MQGGEDYMGVGAEVCAIQTNDTGGQWSSLTEKIRFSDGLLAWSLWSYEAGSDCVIGWSVTKANTNEVEGTRTESGEADTEQLGER